MEPVADAATDEVGVGATFPGTFLPAAGLAVGGVYAGLLYLAYDRIRVAAEGVLAAGRSSDVCAAGRSDLTATLDNILEWIIPTDYLRCSNSWFIAPWRDRVI